MLKFILQSFMIFAAVMLFGFSVTVDPIGWWALLKDMFAFFVIILTLSVFAGFAVGIWRELKQRRQKI
ncbi:hypothetical protein [Campylobacter sp. 7477a]|uniref:hypothetical protein n=1 Tax=Campylobacter sp. 7477a TaxID=2735741 RepID=UPI003014ECCC|nr:hypothetical protein [Campylobacter sp. 7477a]